MLLGLLCALEGFWQHPGFCLLVATPHLGCYVQSNVVKCLLGMEPLVSLKFISLMTMSSIQFASVASAHASSLLPTIATAIQLNIELFMPFFYLFVKKQISEDGPEDVRFL